jgi:hypothetical protein
VRVCVCVIIRGGHRHGGKNVCSFFFFWCIIAGMLIIAIYWWESSATETDICKPANSAPRSL